MRFRGLFTVLDRVVTTLSDVEARRVFDLVGAFIRIVAERVETGIVEARCAEACFDERRQGAELMVVSGQPGLKNTSDGA